MLLAAACAAQARLQSAHPQARSRQSSGSCARRDEALQRAAACSWAPTLTVRLRRSTHAAPPETPLCVQRQMPDASRLRHRRNHAAARPAARAVLRDAPYDVAVAQRAQECYRRAWRAVARARRYSTRAAREGAAASATKGAFHAASSSLRPPRFDDATIIDGGRRRICPHVRNALRARCARRISIAIIVAGTAASLARNETCAHVHVERVEV